MKQTSLLYRRQASGTQNSDQKFIRRVIIIIIRFFWCPRPVSYIRKRPISYIGDRVRAPKIRIKYLFKHFLSWSNWTSWYFLLVYPTRMSTLEVNRPPETLSSSPSPRFCETFGCPRPVSYIRTHLLYRRQDSGTQNFNCKFVPHVFIIILSIFWCPRPVSYNRKRQISYIGDRLRAPKISIRLAYIIILVGYLFKWSFKRVTVG